MFGSLTKLTPKDPKENGYQNPHLVFLMQVRALTRRERVGALMVDAHGLDGHICDASLSRSFGGTTTMFWRFGTQFLGLVTISKAPNLFTCLLLISYFQHVHVLFLCFMRYITCLDVDSIETCVYTCTSSEQQIDLYMFALHVHLYSRYAHVQASFDDSFIYTCYAYFIILLHVYAIFNSNLINIHVYP